ncbi:MAG: ATP-dependent DNA helicase, partial [Niameybacter sp.]
ATTALQEQLAQEGGDIKTLSRLLGLEVDVEMAKDPHQYICDVRVEENIDELGALSDEIHEWLNNTKRGVRSEIPTISDHVWKKMKWEESMACDICSSRGFCKLVKARQQYRLTKDLLIVDHETFFHDLWSRDELLDSGKLPILPD